MSECDFSTFPVLRPTWSTDGRHASIMIDVEEYRFQAVFVCLPSGSLSDPVVHGVLPESLSNGESVEIEAKARLKAMQLKEEHRVELLAGMGVVALEHLLAVVSAAPPSFESGQQHYLADWDALSGADGAPFPPFTRPVLTASTWQDAPAWLFWGTLDTQIDAPDGSPSQFEPGLTQQLGAKHVHIRRLWLGRPEILAFF